MLLKYLLLLKLFKTAFSQSSWAIEQAIIDDELVGIESQNQLQQSEKLDDDEIIRLFLLLLY